MRIQARLAEPLPAAQPEPVAARQTSAPLQAGGWRCGVIIENRAADVVVAHHRFERMEGLLSWGRATGGAIYCPNIRVQFVDNHVVEGNHVWNYNGSYPYPHPKTVEPYSIGILASDQDDAHSVYQGPLNHLVIIKRNRIDNNGGIVVRGHTTNVVVEENQILNSSVSVHVNGSHNSHVYVNHR